MLGAKKVRWSVPLSFAVNPALFMAVFNVPNSALIEISSTKFGVSSSSFSQLAKVKRKIDDKVEHTCPKCGNYDAFMFSSDDECSDCKRKRRDAEDEEEERKKEKGKLINE